MLSIVTGLAQRVSHMREASVQTPGLAAIRSGTNHRTRFQLPLATSQDKPVAIKSFFTNVQL
jgi:hypothetical protein